MPLLTLGGKVSCIEEEANWMEENADRVEGKKRVGWMGGRGELDAKGKHELD